MQIGFDFDFHCLFPMRPPSFVWAGVAFENWPAVSQKDAKEYLFSRPKMQIFLFCSFVFGLYFDRVKFDFSTISWVIESDFEELTCEERDLFLSFKGDFLCLKDLCSPQQELHQPQLQVLLLLS